MIPSPSFTNVRSSAINEFNSLRTRAVVQSWLAKLFQKNTSPKSFVASNASGVNGKRLAGVCNIPVDKIIGTIQRTNDFDKDFRPLKKHLRERWVNALLLLSADGWQPIQVHKVGEFYFISDGHHRVSVAKSVGMMYIEAEIWDHSPQPSHQLPCTSKRKPITSQARVYSTNS